MRPLFEWFILLATMVGCTTGPASPPPAPSEYPTSAPQQAVHHFGAVEAIEVRDSERQVIYRLDERPETKNPGLAGSYYVTVAGTRYMIHWQYAEKLKGLEVGDTVNLHPSEHATCVEGPDGASECHRLYRLYENSRPIPPVMGR